MNYYNDIVADKETKKVCPICRRQSDKDAPMCNFCKYAWDKSLVQADDKAGGGKPSSGGKPVCPYCMGSGTTVGGKCLMCEGTGYFDNKKPRITCAYCTGTGKTVGGQCYMCEGKGYVEKVVEKKVCRYCSGSGVSVGGPCDRCGGRGVIIEDKGKPAEGGAGQGAKDGGDESEDEEDSPDDEELDDDDVGDEDDAEGDEDDELEEVPPPDQV